MLYAFTASHINCINRFVNLIRMSHSLKQLNIPCHVSLSYDPKLTNSIFTLIDRFHQEKLGTIYLHDNRKRQFEHLNYLVSTVNINEPDHILFIDDDDLLLSVPNYEEFNVVQGYLYIPNDELTIFGTSQITYHWFKKNKPNQKNFMKAVDFSGYIVKYPLVVQYFKQRDPQDDNCKLSPILQNLEDCTFMKFCDSQELVTVGENPHVFHRLWSDNGKNTSMWKEECIVM